MSGWENDASFYSDESEDELEIFELEEHFFWIPNQIDELNLEQFEDENGDVEMESSDEDAVVEEMEPLSVPLPLDNFDELLQEILETSGNLLKPSKDENGCNSNGNGEEAVVPSDGRGQDRS